MCARLHEHAEGGRLDGPASTGIPDRSAVSWQSNSFCEPPPTMWMTETGWPEGRLPSARRLRADREALDDASDELDRRSRYRRAVHPAPLGDSGGHVPRREDIGVVRVEDGHPARKFGGSEQLAKAQSPLGHRLGEQPEAHDVAALVGEVGRAAFRSEHRMLELDRRPPLTK